jgi:hypothetical protein
LKKGDEWWGAKKHGNVRALFVSVCIVRWPWNLLQGHNTTANNHSPRKLLKGEKKSKLELSLERRAV